MEMITIAPSDFADLALFFFWYTFGGTFAALFAYELLQFGISVLFSATRRDKELRSDDEAPSRSQ